MSRHQNKYQNKISYLGLALTESGLHACLDLHPDRRRCRRSRSRRSRHDRHPKLVDVQDVELITDSLSCHMIDVQEVELVLEYWIIDVIAVHVIASPAETSCHVNIVVRDAISMSTPDSWQHHDIMNSFLELWYYKSIRSSWIEIRNSKLIFFSTIDDFKSAFKLHPSNPGRKLVNFYCLSNQSSDF
jgi:hypothetical protein